MSLLINTYKTSCMTIILYTCLLFVSVAFSEESSFPEAHISSSDVDLRIYIPDINHGFYRSSRFDWSGMISSASWNNHEFFTKWTHHKYPIVNHAAGTTEEFDIGKNAISLPPGFETCLPGNDFLKVGVGILRRADDNPYKFYVPYEVVDHGSWQIESNSSTIMFRHTIARAPWGYVYEKTISIKSEEPGFVIRRSLKNTGYTNIETTHYSHHFISIDNIRPGNSYRLILPFMAHVQSGDQHFYGVHTNTILPLWPVDKTMGYGIVLNDYTEHNVGNWFRVLCSESNTAISFRINKPLFQFAVYTDHAVFCPEPFIRLSIRPGEVETWETEYNFALITD